MKTFACFFLAMLCFASAGCSVEKDPIAIAKRRANRERNEKAKREKDKTSQSRLTPLTDFNVRKDLSLRKGYLQGRFDALPIIGDISSLATWLGCTTDGAKDAQETPSA